MFGDQLTPLDAIKIPLAAVGWLLFILILNFFAELLMKIYGLACLVFSFYDLVGKFYLKSVSKEISAKKRNIRVLSILF